MAKLLTVGAGEHIFYGVIFVVPGAVSFFAAFVSRIRENRNFSIVQSLLCNPRGLISCIHGHELNIEFACYIVINLVPCYTVMDISDMTPKCWTENPTFGGHIMSKISNEIRLEAVQRVVEDGMSISASARLAGVHKSMLQEWVMQYREHGAEGVIKQDRKQKKYTGEFKIEVVEYAHTNHLSAGAASAHFGLSTKSLFLKWERIYYEEGPQALLEEHRGRASKMGKNVGRKRKLPDQTKEDLIAEVQRLRMENEYLKKLQALVQKRIARENGNGSKSSMN